MHLNSKDRSALGICTWKCRKTYFFNSVLGDFWLGRKPPSVACTGSAGMDTSGSHGLLLAACFMVFCFALSSCTPRVWQGCLDSGTHCALTKLSLAASPQGMHGNQLCRELGCLEPSWLVRGWMNTLHACSWKSSEVTLACWGSLSSSSRLYWSRATMCCFLGKAVDVEAAGKHPLWAQLIQKQEYPKLKKWMSHFLIAQSFPSPHCCSACTFQGSHGMRNKQHSAESTCPCWPVVVGEECVLKS